MHAPSWIRRLYFKIIFHDLPRRIRSTLSSCNGKSLNLTRILQDLSAQEIETTFQYIATHFPHLKSLSLSYNDLTVLPSTIGKLTHLTALDLNGNNLHSLPETIGNLAQLTELDLQDNWLDKLPETIGNLTKLTKLNLRANKFISFPKPIEHLTQLTELSLANNRLSELSETIGNLTQLRILNLFRNELNTLPEAIGHLTQLKELILEDNKLKALPKTIRNLTNLNTLRLCGNRSISLPVSILSLPESLDLGANISQLTFLPENAEDISPYRNEIKHIKAYFKQIVVLPEMEQVRNFLSFTSLSKQCNQLIKMSSKNPFSQKIAVEDTTEQTPSLSKQPSTESTAVTQSFTYTHSVFPNEILIKILLHASDVPTQNHSMFHSEFSKLISEKPTFNSIKCFLDNTSLNWQEVVRNNYKAASNSLSR